MKAFLLKGSLHRILGKESAPPSLLNTTQRRLKQSLYKRSIRAPAFVAERYKQLCPTSDREKDLEFPVMAPYKLRVPRAAKSSRARSPFGGTASPRQAASPKLSPPEPRAAKGR